MNKYLVEFAGTFFLMFIILTLGEALPIGLALTIAIMLGGKISGGHYCITSCRCRFCARISQTC